MTDGQLRALVALRDIADDRGGYGGWAKLSNRTDVHMCFVHRSAGLALLRDGLADRESRGGLRVLFVKINDKGYATLAEEQCRRGAA